jgi:hypothetical protein
MGHTGCILGLQNCGGTRRPPAQSLGSGRKVLFLLSLTHFFLCTHLGTYILACGMRSAFYCAQTYADCTHGRHILNTAEFNVRITVWSLCSTAGVVAALRAPKHAGQGVAASSDGKFLAVAERENCKDYVQIYRCSNWTPIRRFAVDTKDLAELRWAPDDSAIAVWDSVRAFAYRVYVACVCSMSLATSGSHFFSSGYACRFLSSVCVRVCMRVCVCVFAPFQRSFLLQEANAYAYRQQVCMYLLVHANIRARTHRDTHARTHTHIHTHLHTHARSRAQTHTHTYKHAHAHGARLYECVSDCQPYGNPFLSFQKTCVRHLAHFKT